jgi:hypothetical protein
MATKRAGGSKKGAGKKAASKKASAGKGATKKAGATFPTINFKCIEACVERYHRCLQKSVNPKMCQKRFTMCISNHASGIFRQKNKSSPARSNTGASTL